MEIRGHYFAAGRSDRQSANLLVTRHGALRILAQDGQELTDRKLELPQLEISPRIGNTPRHLTLPDGGRFETADNDGVDRIMKHFDLGRGHRGLHWLESQMRAVLLFTLLTALFVWGFVQYGVPAGARLVAQALPAEASAYIGQGTLELLDKSLFEPSQLAPARRQALHDLLTRYSREYPELNAKLLFRKADDIGANALALPDGHIIFTDAMVELAQDDDELVAVLGHELGHLAGRHMLRRLVQDSMLTLVLVLITGDASTASSVVLATPALLLELAYSRDFEREADDFTFQFLQQNNLPTEHFSNIMRRLDNPDRQRRDQDAAMTDFLSTHPATGDRIRRFDSRAH